MARAAFARILVAVMLATLIVLISAWERPALADEGDGDAARSGERFAAAAILECADGIAAGLDVDGAASIVGSPELPANDSTAQWIAFDLARIGLAAKGGSSYLDQLSAVVTGAYSTKAKGLDDQEPTTWARFAIVVHALGGDPTAFGTDATGAPANLLSDGIYNWSYTDDPGNQGSNAWIYALQSLDSCKVEPPEDARYSKGDMLAALLDCQMEDGSFALGPDDREGGVDLTGMALAALAPYRGDSEIDGAVERAIGYLSKQQLDNGRFEAEGVEASESSSMVMIGLCAIGIDPASDERFVKEGGSVLDGLMSFRRPDGTFSHADDDPLDVPAYLASEQALRALIAYEELLTGGDGNVYTLDAPIDVAALASGSAGGPFDPARAAWSWGLGLACGAAAAGLAWIVWARKRGNPRRTLHAG